MLILFDINVYVNVYFDVDNKIKINDNVYVYHNIDNKIIKINVKLMFIKTYLEINKFIKCCFILYI